MCILTFTRDKIDLQVDTFTLVIIRCRDTQERQRLAYLRQNSHQREKQRHSYLYLFLPTFTGEKERHMKSRKS